MKEPASIQIQSAMEYLNLLGKSSSKGQSAMEYLMTYGWAILIIAVVLGALFGLGFFNAANLAPKVAAGSCQVQRPQGPGTTAYINLEGVCNNELPQYVAQFNGQSSNITAAISPRLRGSEATVSLWAYQRGPGNGAPDGGILVDGQLFSYFFDPCNPTLGVVNFAIVTGINSGTQYNIYSSSCASIGQWIQYVGTYDGSTATLYLNGKLASSVAAQGAIVNSSNIWNIGGEQGYNFNGLVSNVQIYNVSLSANEVTALYQEGIGGAPVSLQSLVSWWPLNGNAKDYSGNLNNGVPTNVVFTTSWTNGYSAP